VEGKDFKAALKRAVSLEMFRQWLLVIMHGQLFLAQMDKAGLLNHKCRALACWLCWEPDA